MFLKNKNIISKIRRSKVTDYAALTMVNGCLTVKMGLRADNAIIFTRNKIIIAFAHTFCIRFINKKH